MIRNGRRSFLFIFLHQSKQLFFKNRDIIYAGAVNVLFAKGLILMSGDVSHTGDGTPGNFPMGIFQFLG